MNIENGDIRNLFARTAPELTPRDAEQIRDGVWRKVRRHKTAVKVKTTAAGAIIVILVAVIATFKTSPQVPTNGWDIALMSENELMQKASTVPSEKIAVELLGNDGDSIADAVISDADIETAVKSLSTKEQEELLLALADL